MEITLPVIENGFQAFMIICFLLVDCEGQYYRICKINQYEKIGNVHNER